MQLKESVQMEIQGDEESINRTIQTIQQGSFIQIEHLEATQIPLVQDESGFWTD